MTTAKFTRLSKTALLLSVALLGAASTTGFANAAPTADASQLISAQAQGAARSLKVSYRDLDLSTAAGNRALHERISAAARKVCAVENIRVLDAVAAGASCQSEAVSHALADVRANHPSADYAVNLARR